MELRPLRHFVALAETLHFRRAADQLGMTQPPLSQSIQALERELGAPLFERTSRTVSLTPLGRDWLPQVRAALDSVNALEDYAQRIVKGSLGTLKLSFVSTADYSILPTLVSRFRQLYPDVELSLTEATTDKQISSIMEGSGQAGIIIPNHEGEVPGAFEYRKLVSEPLVAAVPGTWLQEGRLGLRNGQLSPEAVISSPLIVFPREAAPSFHDLVTGYYTECGGTAHVVQHAIQMQTIISLVSAGMGIALVPASLRHLARSGVCYLDLEGAAPELETGIVWRGDDHTPTLRNLLQMIEGMSEPVQGA